MKTGAMRAIDTRLVDHKAAGAHFKPPLAGHAAIAVGFFISPYNSDATPPQMKKKYPHSPALFNRLKHNITTSR